jgi:hypothetical protein
MHLERSRRFPSSEGGIADSASRLVSVGPSVNPSDFISLLPDSFARIARVCAVGEVDATE